MDTSPHKGCFVSVNGIRLHYLDWGGKGEALIFLTGMGCSAHLYDHIAPRFTDLTRVLALTRRGQGESDYPESGYDSDTLVDDILKFMDCLEVDKAILAGHSLAGVELTHFAVKYPDRTSKLIYLDAAFDWRDIVKLLEKDPSMNIENPEKKSKFSSAEEYIEYVKQIRPDLAQIWNESWDLSISYELVQNADGYFVEKDTRDISKAMMETIVSFEPRFSLIKIPVLSFFVMSDNPVYPTYLTEGQELTALDYWQKVWLPWRKKNLRKLQADILHAQIIEIPNGHHYCFMAQEELVYERMRSFLLEENNK